MKLENIVLHKIIKDDKTNIPKLNCSDKALSKDSEDILDFVNRFLKVYNKRRPTQGTFQANKDEYPFQKHLFDYINGGDFITFTKKAMETLKKAIDLPTTKGGYVVFMHYGQNGQEFVVTTMLDISAQFAVDEEELIIAKLKTLNLDELVRANRVNLNKWQNEEQAYLSFIKGKRQVSKFFQTFIGNTDLTSSKINANRLKTGLQEYMREQKYSQDRKSEVFTKVKSYVDRMIVEETDVELRSISAIIEPEAPEKFEEYTIETNQPISASFRSNHKTDFNFLYQSILKGEGYTLSFEKELKKSGKIVRVGETSLTINDMEKSKLDREFGDYEQ